MKVYNLKEYETFFQFTIIQNNKEIGVFIHKEPKKYITLITTPNSSWLYNDKRVEIPIFELAFNEKFIKALKEVNENDFKYNYKEDIALFKKLKEKLLSIV